MVARVIDQVLVVNTGGTGRHASQTRQASIEMLDNGCGRRAILFQHVLDQVDAPTGTVELIAQQHVGRTGRRAEAAVHAFAQYLLRLGGVRILQRCSGELRLHQLMRPGFSRSSGSNAALKRAAIAAMAGACGSNTPPARRSDSGALTKRCVPAAQGTANGGSVNTVGTHPDQAATPVKLKRRGLDLLYNACGLPGVTDRRQITGNSRSARPRPPRPRIAPRSIRREHFAVFASRAAVNRRPGDSTEVARPSRRIATPRPGRKAAEDTSNIEPKAWEHSATAVATLEAANSKVRSNSAIGTSAP